MNLFCEDCPEVFTSHKKLRDHVENTHAESAPRHRCSLCSRLFGKICDLTRHMRSQHPPGSDRGGNPTWQTARGKFRFRFMIIPHLSSNVKNAKALSFFSSNSSLIVYIRKSIRLPMVDDSDLELEYKVSDSQTFCFCIFVTSSTFAVPLLQSL
jgi:hypothetical protein